MREKLLNDKVKFIIGDVRDFRSVSSVTKDVDFIFLAKKIKASTFVRIFPMLQ